MWLCLSVKFKHDYQSHVNDIHVLDICRHENFIPFHYALKDWGQGVNG